MMERQEEQRLRQQQQRDHNQEQQQKDELRVVDAKKSHRNCMSYKIIGILVCVVTMGVVSINSSATKFYVRRSLAVITNTAGKSVVDEDVHTAEEHEEHLRRLNGGLRYAVFGSSTSYGASLESRFDAYPYKLSDTVRNFADYSGGPNYPSVCTETLVGTNDMFDVIIFQYYMAAHDGLEHLARRVRERYPNALLIFLKIWNPPMCRRENSAAHHGYETFREWKSRMGYEHADRETVREAIRNDDARWFFPQHSADGVIRRSIDAVGGHLWDMTRLPEADSTDSHDMKNTLVRFLGLFDETFTHLSRLGHEHVADNLRMLIDREIPDKTQFINSAVFGMPDDHWGKGDACHFWFTDGNCNLDYDHEKLHVIEYDDRHGKYALQVKERDGTTHAQLVTHFNITNPFSEPRQLFLSYLATSPPASGELPAYPETRFHFSGGEERYIRPVTDQDVTGIHIPITRRIITLRPYPHVTQVWIRTMEESLRPFSIVGASITDSISDVNPVTFAPPFNND